jgi:hypothetical protein
MALHWRGYDWVQERLRAFRDSAQQGFKFLQQHITSKSEEYLPFLVLQ